MDPTQALAEIREIVVTASVLSDVLAPDESLWQSDLLDDLVERFKTLDIWMSRGGFSPAQWGQKLLDT